MLLMALIAPFAMNAQQALPYSYGFEDNDLSADGWSMVTCHSSSGINTSAAHSGSYGFRFYYRAINSTYPNQYLVSPELTGTGNGVAVSFYYKNYSSYYAETFQVGYSTTSNDPTTFTYGETITKSDQAWELYEGDFPAGTKYVAIKLLSNDAFYLYLDDFDFTVPASCAKPSNLTYELTPGNGTVASLSWTENGSATQWQVCLDGDETNLIPANTNVDFELTGLTAEVDHTAKVRAYCNANDQSDWSNEVTFRPTNAYALTVNDGTASNAYVPIYGYYVDALTASQFIIPAADLAAAAYGSITQLTFYGSLTGSSPNWGSAMFEVYMTEVAGTTVDAMTDVSTMDKVMNAASLNIVNGTMVVYLDTPYDYMGGNLLIGFQQTVTGTYSACSWVGVTAEGASMGGYGSSINQQNFLPKTTINYIPGEAPTCPKPRNLVAGTPAARSVVLNWTETGEARAWQICLNGDESNLIPANTNEDFLLEGLTPDTDYTIKVRSYCGEDDQSDWSNEVTIHTDVTCPAPTNLTVSGLTPFAANVAWDGTASNFNMRYKEIDASQYAIVTLRTDDVWGDGTGYQLLLDADATAYGTIIPETGGLTSSGDASAETYAEFEYKIPMNADGAMTTTNMVMNSSVTILIPAGTYDFCITNPTPDDRIWIASENGTLGGGRQDDYVFEAGKAYEFYSYDDPNSTNDATDVTIVDFFGVDEGWSTPVAATSPLAFTELNPETGYAVEIQAACGDEDGESAWVPVYFITPSNCLAPFNLSETDVRATSAILNWEGYQDGFEVRYRIPEHAEASSSAFFDDFENGLDNWTLIVNAEGTGWQQFDATRFSGITNYSGNYVAMARSYENSVDITADNWMIKTQPMTIPSTMTYFARNDGRDDHLYDETYDVCVSVGSINTSDFVVVQSFTTAPVDWEQITIDLSAYAGQQGYIAFHHHDSAKDLILIDDVTIGEVVTVPAGDWVHGTTDALFFNTNDNPDYPLIPDTDYEWQVRGENRSCGDEGYTEWSEINTFHTPNECELPTDLYAFGITANSADSLTWTGVQQDFNLRYRTAGFDGYYLNEDLEDGFDYGWGAYNWDDEYTALYYEDEDHTNVIFMMVAANGTTDQYLFSPDFRAEAAGNTLTFDYAGYYSDTPEYFSVGFVTDSVIWDDITTSDSLWHTYTKVVPEGTQYMIIYYEDGFALQLDNFLCYNADDVVAAGPWIETLEGVNSPVAITGLDPETYYEWQVQGNSEGCTDGVTEWVSSEFKTLESEGQTIALVAGTNWFSTYLEIELADLQHALNEALPGVNTGITIKAKVGNSTFRNGNWRNVGGFVWDVAKMYRIEVPADCEITLTGDPINPADHEITILAGEATWIGFPFSESMDPADVIPAGFAVNGDQIKGKDGNFRYTNRWRPTGINALEPGKGYMYVPSQNASDRTLIYSTGSKKAAQTIEFGFKKNAISMSLSPKMMQKAFNQSKATEKVVTKNVKKNNGECKSRIK